MSDTQKVKKEFVAYEYKEVAAENDKVSFLIDGYSNFGWEMDENLSGVSQKAGTICLKRNRKIVNKMELTRLQRNFESCLCEIQKLEKSKTSAATAYALLVGIVGTAFMAGSVFAVTAEQPQILLCILLAVPAFGGWIASYFVYRQISAKRTERIIPLMEEKYDEICEICEKGNRLLN